MTLSGLTLNLLEEKIMGFKEFRVSVFLFLSVAVGIRAQLVPGIITFGDSSVDVGNNNFLPTLFRADFLPYGRDFVSKRPTGRFCNGKLATDITGEKELFQNYSKFFSVLDNDRNGSRESGF